MFKHLQNSHHSISKNNLKNLHTCGKGKKMNLSEILEINEVNKELKFIPLNDQIDFYSSPLLNV